jgi:hypothetical protein
VWSKYRGPGPVRFGSARRPPIEGGKASTTATFTGEYIFRVLAWEDAGGPGPVLADGFQCCKSFDEMFHCNVTLINLPEEEYQRRVEERQSARRLAAR